MVTTVNYGTNSYFFATCPFRLPTSLHSSKGSLITLCRPI
jgi:hypothetical protein